MLRLSQSQDKEIQMKHQVHLLTCRIILKELYKLNGIPLLEIKTNIMHEIILHERRRSM